ncbi:hypothetical protein ACLB2K_055114 [Fragaria x ananassa]
MLKSKNSFFSPEAEIVSIPIFESKSVALLKHDEARSNVRSSCHLTPVLYVVERGGLDRQGRRSDLVRRRRQRRCGAVEEGLDGVAGGGDLVRHRRRRRSGVVRWRHQISVTGAVLSQCFAGERNQIHVKERKESGRVF